MARYGDPIVVRRYARGIGRPAGSRPRVSVAYQTDDLEDALAWCRAERARASVLAWLRPAVLWIERRRMVARREAYAKGLLEQ